MKDGTLGHALFTWEFIVQRKFNAYKMYVQTFTPFNKIRYKYPTIKVECPRIQYKYVPSDKKNRCFD